MLLALAMLFTMSVPAFAVTPVKDFNYIYVDSEEDIDWNSLSDGDVVVVPNSNEKAQADVEKLTETPKYLENAISPAGATAPNTTTVWNIAKKGQYDYAGSAASWSATDLYTNYYFTGCDSYSVKIQNSGSSDVKVSFHGWVFTYRTLNVLSGTTYYAIFNSDTADRTVSTSTNWYMRFSAPCDVSGYVKER